MLFNFLILLFHSFYWFLPAGIANMTPVVAAKIPLLKKWNTPVDGRMKWKNHRILGDNKTWRGLVVGVIFAIITAYIQKCFFLNTLPYPYLDPLVVGTLLGIGALGGDMIESFFKRQLRIPSGKAWFPWDQIDYILGGVFAISFVVIPEPPLVLLTAVIYFLLHLVVSFIGYKFKFKLSPI